MVLTFAGCLNAGFKCLQHKISLERIEICLTRSDDSDLRFKQVLIMPIHYFQTQWVQMSLLHPKPSLYEYFARSFIMANSVFKKLYSYTRKQQIYFGGNVTAGWIEF